MNFKVIVELKDTDKATLFRLEGVDKDVWLPKMAYKWSENGESVYIKDWMANKKGLIKSEPTIKKQDNRDILEEILTLIKEMKDLISHD